MERQILMERRILMEKWMTTARWLVTQDREDIRMGDSRMVVVAEEAGEAGEDIARTEYAIWEMAGGGEFVYRAGKRRW